jgi:hypothetical protein
LKKGDLGGFENHQSEGIFGKRYKAQLTLGGKSRGLPYLQAPGLSLKQNHLFSKGP